MIDPRFHCAPSSSPQRSGGCCKAAIARSLGKLSVATDQKRKKRRVPNFSQKLNIETSLMINERVWPKPKRHHQRHSHNVQHSSGAFFSYGTPVFGLQSKARSPDLAWSLSLASHAGREAMGCRLTRGYNNSHAHTHPVTKLAGSITHRRGPGWRGGGGCGVRGQQFGKAFSAGLISAGWKEERRLLRRPYRVKSRQKWPLWHASSSGNRPACFFFFCPPLPQLPRSPPARRLGAPEPCASSLP